MTNVWRSWLTERLSSCLEAREGVIAEGHFEMRQVLSISSLQWKDEGLAGLFADFRHVYFDGESVFDVIEETVFLGGDFRESGPVAYPELVEEAFDAYCRTCAYKLQFGKRMPSDISTCEELGFTLTNLIETWVRKGRPDPSITPRFGPVVPVVPMNEGEVAASSKLLTHGFRVGDYTIFLCTRRGMDSGLWIKDSSGKRCQPVHRGGEGWHYRTYEDPMMVRTFCLWFKECLQAAGLAETPTIGRYLVPFDDDPISTEELTVSCDTLGEWLRLNHQEWLIVDERVQREFVEISFNPPRRSAIFEEFMRRFVLPW